MFKGTLTLLCALLLSAPLVLSTWVSPSVAGECSDVCGPCHGSDFNAVHGEFSHSASLDSGTVALFADTDHDDAGWNGPKPYFGVLVDCNVCHNNDLPPIHGNECATCHPTPYDTLGNWEGGCQQGGCHISFHDDATTAHLPFEDPYDPGNDCTICHDPASWDVSQAKCLNCHDAYAFGDTTRPTTTSNALADYFGAAIINFSIMDRGKVGIGRTFYQVDGAAVAIGSKVVVSDPGTHSLEFWSKDQYGNIEATTHTVYFNVTEDSTPPTTTSSSVVNGGTYYNGKTISLSATDPSPGAGVKATYYQIDSGSVLTGTTVNIPATSGTFNYTLTYWSEDWAGNVEAQKSVSFTVVSGTVTLRLVWWDCDLYPSQEPIAGDSASWTVRRGSFTGPVVATGSGAASNGWDGIDDITLPLSPTPYYVRIDWESADDGDQADFPNLNSTTPGVIHRLSY